MEEVVSADVVDRDYGSPLYWSIINRNAVFMLHPSASRVEPSPGSFRMWARHPGRVHRVLTHSDAQAGVIEKMQMAGIELQIHRVA